MGAAGVNNKPWVKLWLSSVEARRLRVVSAEAFRLYILLSAINGRDGVGDVLEGTIDEIAYAVRMTVEDDAGRCIAAPGFGSALGELVGGSRPLVEQLEHGLRLVPWNDEQRPMTDAERQAARRERQAKPSGERPAKRDGKRMANVTKAGENRDGERDGERDGDVTPPVPPGVTQQGRAGQSKPGQKPGGSPIAAAWRLVVDNREARQDKVRDLLADDRGLADTVASFGGWSKMVEELEAAGAQGFPKFRTAFLAALDRRKGARGAA